MHSSFPSPIAAFLPFSVRFGWVFWRIGYDLGAFSHHPSSHFTQHNYKAGRRHFHITNNYTYSLKKTYGAYTLFSAPISTRMWTCLKFIQVQTGACTYHHMIAFALRGKVLSVLTTLLILPDFSKGILTGPEMNWFSQIWPKAREKYSITVNKYCLRIIRDYGIGVKKDNMQWIFKSRFLNRISLLTWYPMNRRCIVWGLRNFISVRKIKKIDRKKKTNKILWGFFNDLQLSLRINCIIVMKTVTNEPNIIFFLHNWLSKVNKLNTVIFFIQSLHAFL